jgi:hypothetical protein
MLQSFGALLLSLFVFSSCNNEKKDSPVPEKDSIVQSDIVPEKTTVDTDTNGCKIAAGERWSVIKKTCVVLTETGIRMEPKDEKLDKTKPAYLLFSDDRVRVEIILPTQEKAVIIRKTSVENEPEKWSSGPLTLLYTDGIYKLDDEGRLLYESNSQPR